MLQNLKTAWHLYFVALLTLNSACTTFQKTFIKDLQNSPALHHSFVGFVLMDPITNEILIEHQGDKYFTPASNTKLFTFYAAEKLLRDSIKAFEYQFIDDTLWLQGTGDPSLLHPDLPPSKALDFLKDKQVVLMESSFPEPVYGPGWAWDDYDGSYQREKSSFPVHGNAIRIYGDSLNSTVSVEPEIFTDSTSAVDSLTISRELNKNQFYYQVHFNDTTDVPLKQSLALTASLLSFYTGTEVTTADRRQLSNPLDFYSVHKDSLLRPLLQDSDNFIAEQLILQCSWELYGELNSKRLIEHFIDSLLGDLPHAPVWVDGSGLSRYNMFTPHSICKLLHKIYSEIPQERLFHLLPAGGISGTIKEYYSADQPYIYAKTGTLRHNHNLSGYLIAKSGKVLIFSFMHNHFDNGSLPIKKEMERLLWQIHLHY